MRVSHTYGDVYVYKGEDCITPLPNAEKLDFHSDNATLEEFLDELTLADVAQLVWILAQSTVTQATIHWAGFPRRGGGARRPGINIMLENGDAVVKGSLSYPVQVYIEDEYYSRERCWEHYRWAIGEIIQELG